jgi:uncharacterized MAPEG superfamily protein
MSDIDSQLRVTIILRHDDRVQISCAVRGAWPPADHRGVPCRQSASSRDEPVAPLIGKAGRLDRALRNFLETFPLFTAAVLAAHLAGRDGTLTLWGVQLYFWARLAYVLLYAAGVYLVRSLVWNVATLGIGLILLSLW